MNIIEAMKQLRDDLKLWVANNLREKVSKDEIFAGTNGEADGVSGLVPAPESTDEKTYLCSSGEWMTPDTDEIYDTYRDKQLSAVLDNVYEIFENVDGSIVELTEYIIDLKSRPHLSEEDVQAMIDEKFDSIVVYAGEYEDM